MAESLRRRHGEVADRIEAEGQAFLTRVVEGFAALAQQRGSMRVDASAAPGAVSSGLEQALLERLGE